MKKSQNVTFSDIAKYTNFSKTTISRYFNNPDSLTSENQKIIADALVQLNYQENKVARILANGRTEFVGIIIPNLYLDYYSEMLDQILLTYENYGYKFLVFIGNEEEETERRYIQELMAYKIEGLIVLSHTIPSQELAELHIPIVAIEREDLFVSSVNTDNYAGATRAMELLSEHGCEVMIHINSPTKESIPAYDRQRGFIDYCKSHNLPNQVFVRDMGTCYEQNEKALSDILTSIEAAFPGRRKGIFVTNDIYTNILLNLLFRKYGRLPDNYYLVGFDNSPISRQAILPISTVSQQIEQIAWEAMRLLVSQMEARKKGTPSPIAEPIHKTVEPILLRRATTEKSHSPSGQCPEAED